MTINKNQKKNTIQDEQRTYYNWTDHVTQTLDGFWY